MKKFILCLLAIFCVTPVGFADDQDIQELKQQIGQLKEQINVMQARIDQLEGQKTVSTPPPSEEKLNNLEAKVTQLENSRGGLLKGRWNPDIGVVGDIVAKLDSAKTDTNGSDRVSVREVELVFGSDVDPFSRFDATIAFSELEDASLEEAYLTYFALPANIVGRFGKFKPHVGKAIPVHRDSLETVDEPLVIQKYFGGEGFNKSGVDFTKTLDLPWAITHQLSLGVLSGGNGEDGTAFGSTQRRPTVYSHLKNYLDLNDSTGFELGFSHMAGSRDEDSRFEVQILGADTTLTHHFQPDRTFKLQGEVFNLDRKETVGFDGNLWGLYVLSDLRFHPQWSTGFRFDYVEPVENSVDNPDKSDRGYSGYLTFHQSEFARWRIQYTHDDLATGKGDNQVMLQGTFAIGEHKHKLQ